MLLKSNYQIVMNQYGFRSIYSSTIQLLDGSSFMEVMEVHSGIDPMTLIAYIWILGKLFIGYCM